MSPLTSHERLRRMIAHQEAGRVPIISSSPDATIAHWQREGMPAGTNCVDYLLARMLGSCR